MEQSPYSQFFTDPSVKGLLILDDKGFTLHNQNFNKEIPNSEYHVHALHQLSSHFFGHKADKTVVAVESTENTVLVSEIKGNDQNSRILAVKKQNAPEINTEINDAEGQQ